MIEPKAVVAMVRQAPRAEGAANAEAEIRAELLTADAATKAQWRSVLYSLELDCAARRFRIVGRTTFALADLQGPSQPQPEPLPWRSVVETAPIGKAWQAVCTPGFVFPYAASAPAHPAPDRLSPDRLASAEAQPYQVVVGSFTEPGNAQAASDRLDRAMHSALAGRRINIKSQTVNGRVFAVVSVAGFGTDTEAETFCGGARKIQLECAVRRTATAAQTPRIQPSSARAVSASSAPRP